MSQKGIAALYIIVLAIIVSASVMFVTIKFALYKPPHSPLPAVTILPTSTPIPVATATSSSTPQPSPTKISGTVSITQSSYGQINVPLGSIISLDYKNPDSGSTWEDNFNPVYLQTISNSELKAIKPGTTIFQSEGRPKCSPGSLCPQYIIGIKVTLNII